MEYKTVGMFLLHGTNVNDIIKFTRGGWQVGITQVDGEDIFIKSLDKSIVRCEDYEISEDTIPLPGSTTAVLKVTRIELK